MCIVVIGVASVVAAAVHAWAWPVLARRSSRGLIAGILMLWPALGIAGALWRLVGIGGLAPSEKAAVIATSIAETMNCVALGFGLSILVLVGTVLGRAIRRLVRRASA